MRLHAASQSVGSHAAPGTRTRKKIDDQPDPLSANEVGWNSRTTTEAQSYQLSADYGVTVCNIRDHVRFCSVTG